MSQLSQPAQILKTILSGSQHPLIIQGQSNLMAWQVSGVADLTLSPSSVMSHSTHMIVLP